MALTAVPRRAGPEALVLGRAGFEMEPPLKKPKLQTNGIPALVKCSTLQDRRHILLQDASGQYFLWDVATGLESPLEGSYVRSCPHPFATCTVLTSDFSLGNHFRPKKRSLVSQIRFYPALSVWKTLIWNPKSSLMMEDRLY